MSDSSSKLCSQCSAPLPANAPGGLCPRCLMAQIIGPTQAGDPAAPMPILTPEELAPHFPQLEILECLGRGGMGVVYKARQKSLNRLVALKLLAPERAEDPQFAARFEKEAHALAALNHPHIVAVHDFGQAGGFYFLLMEFVDGVNLRQAMKAGRFTPEQALAVVPPVCEALQYAHEHGIVHRDIKPENLLLDKEGRVKIADFGIAKMLGTDADTALREEGPQEGTLASVAGTPQYMAPEQKAHGVTDHRADIYSLGVVLYEMLTGELPADSLQPPSRKVQIDVRLDEIVLRALEKTPELRYQTAGEFRTQVETVVSTPRGGGRGEEAQTQKSKIKNPESEIVPRFSRTAIVGVCWAGLFFTTIIPWLADRAISSHFKNQQHPWAALISLLPVLLGLAAIPGTTILGWIAVTQIRRSAGTLYGLGLAVFDGLLFPLLALDALLIGLPFIACKLKAWPKMGSSLEAALALLTVTAIAVATVLDTVIIRRVWRTVNQPLGVAQPTDMPPSSPIGTGNGGSTLGKWAFGLFLAGVLGCLLLMAVLPESGYKPGPKGIATPVALLLSLIFGLMSRRDRYGRMALIGNGVLAVLACVALVNFLLRSGYFGNATQVEMEMARQAQATHPFLRVTVRILETHTGFDTSKLLRPDSLLDDGEVKVLAAPSIAVRSGEEIGIQIPEFPLLFQGGSHILSGRTKTLYVTPTLDPGSKHVRYTMEGDVRGEGAKAGSQERLPIRSGSLQLGEWQLMESNSDGARKQLAVLSVEMEPMSPGGSANVAPTETKAAAPKLSFGPVVEREVNDLQTSGENCAISFDSGKLLPVPASIQLGAFNDPARQVAAMAWAKENEVDAVGFVNGYSSGVTDTITPATLNDKGPKCGLLCRQVIAILAENSMWDSATPVLLKKELDRVMHEWSFIPQVVELSTEGKFPTTYLILDTRTHRMGVLQIISRTESAEELGRHGILGANNNGNSNARVKIRYKLVQSDQAKPATATTPTFNPVIERTLNDPNETLKDSLISLDSSTLRTMPVHLSGRLQSNNPDADQLDTAVMDQWLAAPDQRFDAVARLSSADGKVTRFGLRTFHLLAVPIEPEQADQITAEQALAKIDQRLHETAFISRINDLMTDGGKPAAYIFKTAQGQIGVLQIIGFNENPRGVKIRYKLVQTTQATEGAPAR